MPTGIYPRKIKPPPLCQICKKIVSRRTIKFCREHYKRPKVSQDTKKKMSLSHKGINTWTKGKKQTKETIAKITQAQTGEKSHFWKDGRTKNKKYISWIKNKRNRLKKIISKELGSHTFGDWENLKKQYGFTCPCCKKSEPEIKLTEDHVIPLSKGGSDLIENIQPLCLSCNIKKHTKIIKYNL